MSMRETGSILFRMMVALRDARDEHFFDGFRLTIDRGDTIDHPTLEKCVVVGVLGDDAVKVRLVNGSVRKLVMRGFRLYREGDHHFRIERKT